MHNWSPVQPVLESIPKGDAGRDIDSEGKARYSHDAPQVTDIPSWRIPLVTLMLDQLPPTGADPALTGASTGLGEPGQLAPTYPLTASTDRTAQSKHSSHLTKAHALTPSASHPPPPSLPGGNADPRHAAKAPPLAFPPPQPPPTIPKRDSATASVAPPSSDLGRAPRRGDPAAREASPSSEEGALELGTSSAPEHGEIAAPTLLGASSRHREHSSGAAAGGGLEARRGRALSREQGRRKWSSRERGRSSRDSSRNREHSSSAAAGGRFEARRGRALSREQGRRKWSSRDSSYRFGGRPGGGLGPPLGMPPRGMGGHLMRHGGGGGMMGPPCQVPLWLANSRLQPSVRKFFESLFLRGQLKGGDLEPACITFLEPLPVYAAILVLEEFASLDLMRIRNLTAFFIGICKRVAARAPPPPGRPIRPPQMDDFGRGGGGGGGGGRPLPYEEPGGGSSGRSIRPPPPEDFGGGRGRDYNPPPRLGGPRGMQDMEGGRYSPTHRFRSRSPSPRRRSRSPRLSPGMRGRLSRSRSPIRSRSPPYTRTLGDSSGFSNHSPPRGRVPPPSLPLPGPPLHYHESSDSRLPGPPRMLGGADQQHERLASGGTASSRGHYEREPDGGDPEERGDGGGYAPHGSPRVRHGGSGLDPRTQDRLAQQHGSSGDLPGSPRGNAAPPEEGSRPKSGSGSGSHHRGGAEREVDAAPQNDPPPSSPLQEEGGSFLNGLFFDEAEDVGAAAEDNDDSLFDLSNLIDAKQVHMMSDHHSQSPAMVVKKGAGGDLSQ
eukprot:gene19020-25612_t